MAQRIITELVDDLNGKEIPQGQGETVTFALDGDNYEIDLEKHNAEKLRALLAPYTASGRRAGAPGPRNRSQRRVTTEVSPSAVRAWAASRGIEVSNRGRISASVVEKYRAAGN